MAFKSLIRFERDGNVHCGELLEISAHDFNVTKVEGNLSAGLLSTSTEPFIVEKVGLIRLQRPCTMSMDLTLT